MTKPRSAIVSLEATPYYHCISRCVRRAFLCGKDNYTGKSFDHRKPWLLRRIKFLSEIFAINIAAYAIMSNHYHLVVHIDKQQTHGWSDEEIIERWLRIYTGPELIHRLISGEKLLKSEQDKVQKIIDTWRARLCSISWFMACLNEYMARRANKEDGCKGRFWEGRFKSQALLDTTALLSCMSYVDLNPVRAGLVKSLSESDFTSIQARIEESSESNNSCKNRKSNPELMPFSESRGKKLKKANIPFHLNEYIEMVDWTARIVRKGKRGCIHKAAPKSLIQLGLNQEQWIALTLDIQKRSITALHGMEKLISMERKIKARKVA